MFNDQFPLLAKTIVTILILSIYFINLYKLIIIVTNNF